MVKGGWRKPDFCGTSQSEEKLSFLRASSLRVEQLLDTFVTGSKHFCSIESLSELKSVC